jgi:hypothetical protein
VILVGNRAYITELAGFIQSYLGLVEDGQCPFLDNRNQLGMVNI